MSRWRAKPSRHWWNAWPQEPNNEELKEEIRSFDLLARKAYFTSQLAGERREPGSC